MPDSKRELRLLDRLDPPDLWDEIEHRGPSPPTQTPPTPRRWLVGVLALAIAVAGVGFVVRAFTGGPAQLGSTSSPPAPTTTPSGPGPTTVATPSPTPVQFAPTAPTEIADTIQVGGPPGAVSAVLSAFGSVWVAGYTGGQPQRYYLLRINPATDAIIARIALDTVPIHEVGGGGMTAGDGSLWIAGAGSPPSGGKSQAVVERIDPSTNSIIDRVDLGGTSAADVAVDSTGVWVAIFGPTDTSTEVVRIDPATGEVVATIPLESQYVRSIFALEGSVIVEERETHGDTVGDTFLTQIDPATNQTVATIDLNVALGGSDGDLWAVTNGGILKLDPATGTIMQAWSSAHIGGVVRPAQDGVWMLSLSDQSAFRFDPNNAVIDAAIEMKQDLVDLAVTRGAVWILTYSGSLVRVNVG